MGWSSDPSEIASILSNMLTSSRWTDDGGSAIILVGVVALVVWKCERVGEWGLGRLEEMMEWLRIWLLTATDSSSLWCCGSCALSWSFWICRAGGFVISMSAVVSRRSSTEHNSQLSSAMRASISFCFPFAQLTIYFFFDKKNSDPDYEYMRTSYTYIHIHADKIRPAAHAASPPVLELYDHPFWF